jgi:hypothetical protein
MTVLMRGSRLRPALAIAATAAFALGVVACGDDSGSASSSKYCDAEKAIETVPEPDIHSNGPEAIPAIKEYATTQLKPLAANVAAAAPSEVKETVATLVKLVDDLAATGDFSLFEKPENKSASDKLHAFDLKTCKWTSVAVTATDYKFDGISATLKPGLTSFEFTNNGPEIHEFQLARRKAGVTDSFDDLLKLSQEEAGAKVDMLGGVGPTEQKKSDYKVVDLTPGDYVALCFLPVGSTSMDAMQKLGDDAQPHFMKGMKMEFTVK